MPVARIPRSPVAAALLVYRLWRRLPPKQRRKLLEAARRHGPRIAALAAQKARTRRRPLL